MKQRVPSKISWPILAIIFIGALIAIFFANSKFYSEYIEGNKKIGETTIPERSIAWIEIDLGNGSKRLFEGDLHGGSYPLTVALKTAAYAGNFSYKIEGGKVTSLANRKGNWKIYRNGNFINDAIDKIIVKKGDTYSFRLE